MTEYRLIRTDRKSLVIYITEDAALEVRAPHGLPKADIDRFVRSKARWIEKHLSSRQQCARQRKAFSLSYGSRVLLRGKEYPVMAQTGGETGFDGAAFRIPPGLDGEGIRRAVIRCYKLLAKEILTRKAACFAERMGTRPASIKINSAKTHWGSCSGRNNINFSWRLIMAEDSAIDYVVLHELAHIRERNHSAGFWAVVASVLPDYMARRQTLRALQDRLSREDWG